MDVNNLENQLFMIQNKLQELENQPDHYRHTYLSDELEPTITYMSDHYIECENQCQELEKEIKLCYLLTS